MDDRERHVTGARPLAVGAFDPAFDGITEPERRSLWQARGGTAFEGLVGRVRRLARVVPRAGPALPFRLPLLFTMDGPGTYFGDDVHGLWNVFAGESRVTRMLWGRILMGGAPRLLVADVALGRTSLIAEQRGLDAFLHHLVAWARLPVLTPARLYFGWRRRKLRLDSYEVHGVKFLPGHGRYTVVTDPRRILWHSGFVSLASHLAER